MSPWSAKTSAMSCRAQDLKSQNTSDMMLHDLGLDIGLSPGDNLISFIRCVLRVLTYTNGLQGNPGSQSLGASMMAMRGTYLGTSSFW